MEQHEVPTIDSNKNNNFHSHHRRKKRTIDKQQQLSISSSAKNRPVKSASVIDASTTNQRTIRVREQQQQQQQQQQSQTSMKKPLAWTKKWTKWFSSCGSERTSSHVVSHPVAVSSKRDRTKSENDVSKRGSVDQDEKKKLPTTNSTFAVADNQNEHRTSQTFSQHRHHHQSNDKVNNSNTVVYRDSYRRYSSPFSSYRFVPQQRTSISAVPIASQRSSKPTLSRSVDRLTSKTTRREWRYEEHDDYIPPPLYSIQCHPTIDHYARTLNPSSSAAGGTYYYSTHRRSQIEAYHQSLSNNNTNRLLLPRPYSSNIPILHPNSTLIDFQTMSQTNSPDNHTYGKLSDYHSALTPVENSSIKAPKRIETPYGQFPTLNSPAQEHVYANTQSLYDNILYPQQQQSKKSCASQTQLTWTMATFSSFVDLENQSIIIPQPDPQTLYSIVQHYHPQISHEIPPSASPETIEHLKRLSPGLHSIDDSTHYQRPRTPPTPNVLIVEKRDSSFQTLVTIAPTQDNDSARQFFIHDATPSPISTGSSTTTGHPHHHHHHHHHHRKHKSRSNTSGSAISTRDVGLQVSIQTVKKITFSTQKSGEESSSLATTTSLSSPTVITSRDVKNVETNTDPMAPRHDMSTSYEPIVRMVTSSSQTLDFSIGGGSTSPTNTTTTERQTKAAQTPSRALRDQASETNQPGLFVCDLSSLLTNGTGSNDESLMPSTSIITKRKS